MSINQKKLGILCQAYGLGTPLSQPMACLGGLLHRTWTFRAGNGQFVIKELNPAVIGQPQCKENYHVTELIARSFAPIIPTVYALTHNDGPLFVIEDQTFMVFPHIPGSIMPPNRITLHHAAQMGKMLAAIHQASINLPSAPKVEWPNYSFLNDITKIKSVAPEIASLLAPNEMLIQHIREKLADSRTALLSSLVISHRDCDPKNVLWSNEEYTVIDWESAGLINKTKDLVVTALYWSLDTKYQVNPALLIAFLNAYKKDHNILPIDEEAIEMGFYGLLGDWLNWLDFNLARLLKNPQPSTEFKLGVSEAKKTLSALPVLNSQLYALLAVFCQSIFIEGGA